LKSARLEYTAPIHKPFLTIKHQEAKLAWANEHTEFDWQKVIFTDETTIVLNQHPTRVWQKRGAKKVSRTVKHPAKVHVWGCFSSKGFGKIYIFTKNMNADLLCEIYEHALLPSAQYWFGKDTASWVLQEDNDPKHTSKAARAWREEHGITRLPWPAQSPDQNPIENVWKLIKSELRKNCPKTVVELKRKIAIIWKALPNDFAENLAASMKDRIHALIGAKGGYTLY
jgi:hypothetical protein